MEAMTMGDRIVAMKDGIIQQIDEPLKIYNKPNNEFVAGFIGSPAMNFLDIEYENSNLFFGGISIEGGKFNIDKFAIKPKKVGIRAERLSLNPAGSCDISFKAILEVSEKMGHESLHHVRLDGINLIMREMEKGTQLQPGSEIVVGFDLKDCHFFDEKGNVIPANWPIDRISGSDFSFV